MAIKIFYEFAIVFVVIILLDFLWLGLLAKNFYNKELKNLSREKFNFYSALIVYVLLALGITLFVLNSNMCGNLYSVFLFGVLFGLIVYGVYDFTNHALLEKWPLKLTLVDVLWGGFLCGAVSLITKYISNLIK